MIIQGSDVRQYLPQFLQHYASLTCDDRYNRFFHTMSPEAIRDWLLKIEDKSDEKHVFSVLDDENGNFIGVVQLAIHKDTSIGDVSISVIPDYQRCGLGTVLVKSSVRIAKEQGVRELQHITEVSNRKCRDLYSKVGFTSQYDPIENCICGSLIIGE